MFLHAVFRQLIVGILLLPGWAFPSIADSSSPLLAAYYDRQMAIVGGRTYLWQGDRSPRPLRLNAVQVGVGDDISYILTEAGVLQGFRDDPDRRRTLMTGVARFAAGNSGVLAITTNGVLWWIEGLAVRKRITSNVVTAAVGDGANYYVTVAGALFVRGKAHRGQYGDGRLTPTDRFIKTADNVAQITAHTGHAILLSAAGEVLGTGGNIYGPVGRHGIGDKAVRWSKFLTGARAIATGSSHTLAILKDSTLVAWGSEYGPEPTRIMTNVAAVAAGSSTTIALKQNGSLWQWDRGQKPRRLTLERERP
jgi:alpha-tubulin suppressor-like RCC1 family protein